MLLAHPNDLGHRRLGVTVSTRVSKRAVHRNRVKRLFREAFRRERACLPEDHDFVFIARGAALGASYLEVVASLKEASAQLSRIPLAPGPAPAASIDGKGR